MRRWLVLSVLVPLSAWTASDDAGAPGYFVDATSSRHIQFRHRASHTSRKYLLETMGSGVALFDYDNDGRLDLFLVNGASLTDPTPVGTIPQKSGPQDWNRLYHQKADGTFEDVTLKAGVQGIGYGMGVAVGDYDNDGFDDFYVTAFGHNTLYRNQHDGTFADVTAKAHVAGSGFHSSAAWVDLDNDGLLDLVVLRYVDAGFEDVWCGEHKPGYRAYCHPDTFKPVAPLVFRNRGDGTFAEIGGESGLNQLGKGLGLAIADYDGDGRTDIFVANDSWPQFLYRNQGKGLFEERALSSGVAFDVDGQSFAGMGTDFADYDNDGRPDLAVDALANQKYALYRNDGDGAFSYATEMAGLGRMTVTHSGWGLHFLDYDNDGRKDLLIAQGHDLDTIELTSPNLHYREPMLLARNAGRKFLDVSAESGPVFRQVWAARGLAVGDIDNDGRLDAVVTTNDGPAHLLHNETPARHHWLTLELVGHKSNRDAIGATVKITTATVGAQFATVSTASSYLSSSDKRVHFGIGQDTVIDKLEIRWPSGTAQTLEHVTSDRLLKVEEP